MAGCSSASTTETPTPSITHPQFSLPSPPSSAPAGTDTGTSAPEAQQMLKNYTTNELTEPTPDPSSTTYSKEYGEYLKRMGQQYKATISIDGVPYTVVADDLTGLGESKPLKIAILPDGTPTREVKFGTPTVSFTSGYKEKNGKVYTQGAQETPSLTCDKDSVNIEALLVTCAFTGAIPNGSLVQFFFIVDDTHQQMLQIPVNK